MRRPAVAAAAHQPGRPPRAGQQEASVHGGGARGEGDSDVHGRLPGGVGAGVLLRPHQRVRGLSAAKGPSDNLSALAAARPRHHSSHRTKRQHPDALSHLPFPPRLPAISVRYFCHQSSGKTCLGYFREIQFLSTITLLTTLSGTNSSWTFTTGQCSMEWVSATMPVSQQVYNQDMNAANDKQMAWCYSWCVRRRPAGRSACAVECAKRAWVETRRSPRRVLV